MKDKMLCQLQASHLGTVHERAEEVRKEIRDNVTSLQLIVT